VNTKIRQKIVRCKQRIERRLDKQDIRGCDKPIMTATNIHYEIDERTRVTAQGGIGMIHRMVKKLGLDQAINNNLPLLKLKRPYHESDHVLNIAYNMLAGGKCLEHLELRRTDEPYLDALGARRIPDPTTAGDFCRRFGISHIVWLQEIINSIRLKVWQQQPESFFDKAVIEADGTMVETTGQCKQGMEINYKGQWGYHPLVVSLANTSEPLFVANRSGNRPSHEHAFYYFDKAIALCRQAGFKKIHLRGDTDFTQTEHLDRWNGQKITFVFGIDAMDRLYEIAGELPLEAWKTLERREKYTVKTQRRGQRENVKQQVVEDRKFEDIRLVKEHVAEFPYQPTKCKETYRVVVVWKDLHVYRGQKFLFDKEKCFFYITNDKSMTAEEIVFDANARCNQENLHAQLKGDVRSLTAPLDNLVSNWAYMVMSSLAWSLKAWAALLLPENGRWKDRHRTEKQKLLRMDFSTFRAAMMQIPTQIVTTGRRIVCRLLGWNPWQHVFFRLLDQLARPLRC